MNATLQKQLLFIRETYFKFLIEVRLKSLQDAPPVRCEMAIEAISWLGPKWVHVRLREIDNIAVKTHNFARNLKL